MLLGPRAVAAQIVMIGGTGALHVMNRRDDMVVNCLDVTPIVHPVRERGTGKE